MSTTRRPATRRRAWLPAWLAAVCLTAASAAPAAAGNESPTVAIQGFPANNKLVLSEACTGPDCDSDCTWTRTFTADVNDDTGIKAVKGFVGGVEKVVANTPAPGCGDNAPTVVSSTFTHTFGVTCNSSQTFKIKFQATDCGSPELKSVDEKELELKCKPWPPQPQSSVESNGSTYVDLAPEMTWTNVQFAVLNLSLKPSLVTLALTSTQDWLLGPIPSLIEMGPGESIVLFVDVFVPGGLPEGTTSFIMLTAENVGMPDSASTAVADVTVLTTNVFHDFGIEDLRIFPGSGTSYDVEVDVSVTPGTPWTEAIELQILTPAGDVLDEELVAGGQPSGQCCHNADDCDAIAGWSANCSISECDDPDEGYRCAYRRTATFSGVYFPAGGELMAVLDPQGIHPETGPGADANNTLAATVPLPNVNRSIEAIDVAPGGGPGLFDISIVASLQAVLDENALDLSALYQLFINGEHTGDAIVRSLSASAEGPFTCYDSSPPLCSGNCPQVSWEGNAQNGTCGGAGSACMCNYSHEKFLAGDIPLAPGDQVMVCLVALPEAEPEAFQADDCLTMTQPPGACLGDVNDDLTVDVSDLVGVVLAWGPCPVPAGGDCPGDLDDDGFVAVSDLVTVVLGWGPCASE